MSTPFKPLEIPPGVVAMPTKKMRSSNWSEVNLVRWREGQLMPMGGQAQLANLTGSPTNYRFASRCRKIHGWYGLDGQYHIAYLCETNLYVDTGGTLTDISPTPPLTAPGGLVGGYGDDLYDQGVQLTATAPFTTTSPNITMSPNTVGVVPGMDVFDVTTNKDIGTVSTFSGTALVLTANAASASQGANDLLNFGAYNQPRALPTSVAVTRVPDAYSLDNFGSILYAMTSADGRLLMWDPAVGGPAVVQPASSGRGPVPNGRCFVVTQERFIMIFGSVNDGTAGGGGPRRFAWCDQENPGAWDYSNVTSQAGFLDIEPASPIICAIETRSGVLIWTAKKAYVSQFLGIPYIYNYVELSDSCTPWSPQSMATTSSLSLWMAEQGVFTFDGTSIMPAPCKVRPWVDSDIDPVAVRELSFAAHLAEFNEWWWFFPQLNSPYNSRAIVYNYKEGWWTQARMSRSAGITSSYTSHSIFADDFVAFQHEVGSAYANYNAPVTLPFAESFDLNINSGSRLTTVKQLIPDVKGITPGNQAVNNAAIANLLYSVFYRNSRSLGVSELQSIPVPVRSDGYVDVRVTGRDVRLRLDMATPVIQPFTLGQHLIDAVPRGDR
jgi:hypothetical protein